MKVISWYPAVIAKLGPGGKGILRPHLELHVIVVCPVCQTETECTPRLELSPWEIKWRKNLGWLVGHAADQRICAVCGVLSVIPPRQHDDLLAQVQDQVTSDWLQQCVERMDCGSDTRTERAPEPDGREFKANVYYVPFRNEKEVIAGEVTIWAKEVADVR